MDSFQLNRKTNCRNSHNTLHWLSGPQSKCLEPGRCKTRSGTEPHITHLMLQPRCPAAALGMGTVLGPHHGSDPALLCSLVTGNWGPWLCPYTEQQGRRQGRDQFYCWMVKASSTLILSNQGTGRGGGSLQCSLM